MHTWTGGGTSSFTARLITQCTTHAKKVSAARRRAGRQPREEVKQGTICPPKSALIPTQDTLRVVNSLDFGSAPRRTRRRWRVCRADSPRTSLAFSARSCSTCRRRRASLRNTSRAYAHTRGTILGMDVIAFLRCASRRRDDEADSCRKSSRGESCPS